MGLEKSRYTEGRRKPPTHGNPVEMECPSCRSMRGGRLGFIKKHGICAFCCFQKYGPSETYVDLVPGPEPRIPDPRIMS